MDEFDFNDGSTKSIKDIIIKILIVTGIVALVATIIGILILPSHISTAAICDNLGLGGNIWTGTCNTKYDQIIYVVGDTQNTPKPQLSQSEYISLAYNDGTINSNISVISVSDPSTNPTAIISSKTEVNADERADTIINAIDNMAASSDGADYLEAIRTATKYASTGNNSLIYVIGSGLSDKGILNFADNEFLSNDISAEQIVRSISTGTNSQNHDNIAIIWDGIGKTLPPQDSPSNDNITKLENIYTGVLNKYGFSNIKFIQDLSGKEPVKTDKKVKPTKIAYSITIIYTGNNAEFQFIANSDKFIDESASSSEADKLIADQIYNHPSGVITITSYMARSSCGNDAIDQDLLQKRLTAVENLFKAKGVTNKIVKTAGGIGSINECPEGYYDETLAKQNRKVIFDIANQ